jgi:hypothetical protein
MITACFARRRQRCTDRVELGFLFMLQEVSPIGKTRNQLSVTLLAGDDYKGRKNIDTQFLYRLHQGQTPRIRL